MKSNKFYQFKTLFFLLLMMLVASCSNEMEFENTPAPDNWDGEIVLSMSSNLGWGANSRSESSETTVEDIKAFFQDKCLFMFITANEQNTSLMNEVIGLQYSDDGFKFGNYEKGEDGILAFTAKEGYVPKYPQDSGMDLYFVAISKYSELPVLQEGNALPTINHKISANQKDSNADSDLLYASVKNQSKTATPIVLNFKHLLSKVSIAYQPEEYEGKLLNAVFLENCYDAVNLNLTAGTISNSGTETSIRIRTQRTDDFNTPQYCEAYVAPATYAANSTFIKFCYNYNEENKTSDKVVSYNIPKGKEFVSGYQYKYHMNVYKNGDIVMEDPTIYIYGSAIGENAYNLPVLEAQKMTYDEGTGEYSWTGNISNLGDFKFTCQADAYWPGYVKNRNNENMVLYCTEYESSDEPKFTVRSSGEYKVTLNPTTKFITITSTSEPIVDPLYICGDATSVGWTTSAAEELEYDSETKTFKYLNKQMNKGEFIFICSKDKYWPSYRKDDSNNVVLKAKYHQTDPGSNYVNFNIIHAGTYDIEFNIETLDVTITPKSLNPLYIYGDALNGWETTNFVEMTNTPGTYEFNWEGSIQKDKQFRFSTQKDNDYQSLYLFESDLLVGNKYMAKFYSEYKDMNKPNFWIYTDGNYKITIDISDNEVTILPTAELNLPNLYISGRCEEFTNWSSQGITVVYDSNSYSYKWTGSLGSSYVDFRFLCQQGAWWPSYGREIQDNDTKAKYYQEDNKNDYLNFYTGEAGNYTIQLFPLTLGVKITKN